MDRGYLSDGIPDEIPPHPGLDPEVDHAPKRIDVLNSEQKRLAVRNALRYFDQEHHAKLAPEFAQELSDFGRIYMLRYRPVSEPMRAYPIETYPAKSPQTAAIMHMIQNNLDPEVAQFPNELITYGGNGSVFQNWAQYLLTMQYLSQ
ncbi:MAG: urocanate hydratase, partial [Candidatus Thermoplasmatota archaeon]|nr:urocanate hydratase [Candidatus Thermoplasmatota archaeon]